MARTVCNKTTLLGAFPTLPITADTADVVLSAADVGNMNYAVHGGRDILFAFNSGGSPYTVTITSAPLNGRSGDITTYSIGAGEIAAFGPFTEQGWKQADGSLYFQASNVAVKFFIITIP